MTNEELLYNMALAQTIKSANCGYEDIQQPALVDEQHSYGGDTPVPASAPKEDAHRAHNLRQKALREGQGPK